MARTKKKPTRKNMKSGRKPARKTVRKVAAKRKKAQRVNPIPKGFHSVTVVLTVTDPEAALKFYAKAFSGKELYVLREPSGKIGHAEMKIGDTIIMLGGEYPELDIHAISHYGGSPVRLNLAVKDADATCSRALQAGATMVRPLEDQFYGMRSGNLKDPFGYEWMVSTQIEVVSPREMQKRWDRMMAQQDEGSA